MAIFCYTIWHQILNGARQWLKNAVLKEGDANLPHELMRGVLEDVCYIVDALAHARNTGFPAVPMGLHLGVTKTLVATAQNTPATGRARPQSSQLAYCTSHSNVHFCTIVHTKLCSAHLLLRSTYGLYRERLRSLQLVCCLWQFASSTNSNHTQLAFAHALPLCNSLPCSIPLHFAQYAAALMQTH